MWETVLTVSSRILDKLPLVDVLMARNRGRQEHDRRTFAAGDGILTESMLSDYCSDTINYEVDLERGYHDAIDRYLDWVGLAGNQFMIASLNHKRDAFDT